MITAFCHRFAAALQFAAALPASAASFDCSKGRQDVELVICADKNLFRPFSDLRAGEAAEAADLARHQPV